ncbi:hypothetical protein [Streptomyces purpureus]|uniref:hypothetical protein n=1 Tax=Streptomyces purpureus TaxID=1951 RepID=UPI000381F1F4|nr:hypothetical protein [Streptomyces purpureus]
MTTPPQPPYHPQPQGYPQPAPAPGPYGPPQGMQPQPFPQQYPGQGGWGGPPMGPPPKKKRTGLVVGIVAGSLVLLGGLGYGVYALLDAASGASRPFPEAKYRLTVQKTLLDGEYKLLSDVSKTEGKEVEDTYDPSVRDAKAAIAQYQGASESVLVVSGFHGRLKDPENTRKQILKGAVTDKGTTVVVRPKDFKPAGSDTTVTCQVARTKDGGMESTFPMCAWGDDNTASFVAIITPEIARQNPKEVDLAKLADQTAKVRDEMRTPIG